MRDQDLGRTSPDMGLGTDYSLPFITDSYRNALERLGNAFAESWPLAILVGAGNSDASYVITSFLANLSDDVDVARVNKACADPVAGMREVIQGIGFDAQDMKHADLDNVLTMFLKFQRSHHRRTVLCFEEVQDSDSWMLDRIRELVELEKAGQFGLMVLISGQAKLGRLLNEPPLSAIRSHAEQAITLAPFTLTETAEYIRRRIGSTGNVDISQVFEFLSISVIHELSFGVPDAVVRLCTRCLELKEEQGAATITPAMVKSASSSLETTSLLPQLESEPESEEVDTSSPIAGRFIATVDGEIVQEHAVNPGHILIGRDKVCDIRLKGDTVSRYHALIIVTPNNVKIVDLGSTNGTFADGRRITQRTFKDGDVANIGDFLIEYIEGEDRQALIFDTERTTVLGSQRGHAAPTSTNHNQDDQSLVPAIERLMSSHRRARRS